MEIASKTVTWTISGASDDLAQFAVLAPGEGPQGEDVLKLKVDLDRPIEAREEKLWPVEPGRAYQMKVSTMAALNRSHGQAVLVWLDADQKTIGEAGSEFTFAKHAYAPLVICQTAPEAARYARAHFRLVGDIWPSLHGIEGEIWVTPASLEPAVEVLLSATTAGALYDADQPVEYNLVLGGAPATLGEAALRYCLVDYDGKLLGEYDQTVGLDQGCAQTRLSLPVLPIGYYELVLTVSAPGLAPTTLTKTFGCLGQLDFKPSQDSPIALDAGTSWPTVRGIQGHCLDLPQRFAEQAASCYKLGLRSLRDRFGWGEAQPTPEPFDWGRYRRAANAQHAAGIDVYQMSSSTPDWSVGPTENKEIPGNYPPGNVDLAYDFGRRLAREVGHAVRYFEWWNEPDIFFYGGHPWDLAAFVKAGTLGIKDVDPTLGILGASRCSRPDFWRKWLANGVGPYFDIYNQHSYGKPEDQWKLEQENRDLMAEVGLERPIWMTEMGQRSSPSPDGTYTLAERVQVVYMLRAYASGLASGLDRFFYFYLQEFLEAGVHLWGLQRQDLSPKPAVLALGALVRQIGRARVVGYTDADEQYCVVFERLPGDYTAMVWSTKNSIVTSGMNEALPVFEPGQDWMKVDGEFDLPVVSGACLVDAIGRKVTDYTGSTAHVKLSLCPLFVRGVNPNRMKLNPPVPTLHYVPTEVGLPAERHVWLQAQTRPNQPRLAQADAQAQKNALLIKAGEPELVALTVHNYNAKRVRVTIALNVPQGWQLTQVQTEAGPHSEAVLVPLEVEAHNKQVVTVALSPLSVPEDKESCFGACLYLDGVPHDQVAVYYTTKLPERRRF
ncbi:MAG: hypothetical protein ACYC6L_11485 [Anaerolineae bacterium]